MEIGLARIGRRRYAASSALVAVALAVLSINAGGAAASSCTLTTVSDIQAAINSTTSGLVTLCQDVTGGTGDSLSIPTSMPITLDLHGFSLSITSPPVEVAAINVPEGASLTVEDLVGGSVLTAHGNGSPGIGEDYLNVGTLTIDSGTVDATGGEFAAGVGGGLEFLDGPDASPVGGGTVVVNGGVLNAAGPAGNADVGSGGPGIGGGSAAGSGFSGGSGGSLTVNGGIVTAVGGKGNPGVGGGSAPAGGPTNGAVIDVAAGGSLSATGSGSVSAISPYSTLTNAGTLTIPAGATFDVQNSTATNTGVIDLAGTLSGPGSVDNSGKGSIVVAPGGSVSGTGNNSTGLLVAPNNYLLSFESDDSSTAPSPLDVYSDTVADSQQSLPAGPTPPSGQKFTGWFTAATGGTQVTDSSALSDAFPNANALTEQTTGTLYAQYAVITHATLSPGPIVYGQRDLATATVTEADGSSPVGSVQFGVDGTPVGAPVTVQNGTATSPNLNPSGVLALGAHQISAMFIPAGSGYLAAGASAQQTVETAATTTTVSVTSSSIEAEVAAAPPGAGSPTGTVTFSIDGTTLNSAPVNAGVAILNYTVPTGKSHEIAAVYSGSTDFNGSSGSTARTDPTISAHLSSSRTRTRFGWYSRPVTVKFTCAATSAPLTSACPAPVTLTRDGASLTVTRTIHASDGGVGTVSVRGINIDARQAVLKLHGARTGNTYLTPGPAHLRCIVAPGISGQATPCRLTIRRSASSATVTLTVTDRNGLTTTLHVRYQLRQELIIGAPLINGRYVMSPGHNYLLEVASTTQPYYLYAAPAGARPGPYPVPITHIRGDLWAIRIGLPPSFLQNWTVAVQILGRTILIPITLKHG